MPGIKELKRRIKSIHSMRKITRAMQMVSAAKMRKAQNATLASRSYSSLAWELILNLTRSSGEIARTPSASEGGEAISSNNHETASDALAVSGLLRTNPNAKKIGVVLLSTNMGLVGSLNSNLMPKVKEIDRTDTSDTTDEPYTSNHEVIAEIITYGKNAKVIAGRLKKNILADFPKIDKTIATSDIYPLAQYISDIYKSGQYKKIVVVYNHFISTLVQKATVKQLLPFGPSDNHPHLTSPIKGEETADSLPLVGRAREGGATTDYLFEPDPKDVLEHLLPRIIESQIYQAILESNASEHSARMVMMKNATEAAGDLISDLTLTYNQLRQNKITTELAEITAGRIALE